jgi:hypothetical protein
MGRVEQYHICIINGYKISSVPISMGMKLYPYPTSMGMKLYPYPTGIRTQWIPIRYPWIDQIYTIYISYSLFYINEYHIGAGKT